MSTAIYDICSIIQYMRNIIPSNIKYKKRFGNVNKNGRNKLIKKIVEGEKIKE